MKRRGPPSSSPRSDWQPEGTDRANLEGLEQEAESLDAWLAAGGERRRRPRGPQWDPTQPLGLDPLGTDAHDEPSD